jgi:histidine kinase/DNA gyrase B/HSP90-like ATPase
VKLERTTFETSRAAEYFDARQLSALTGVPQYEFASVCLKELIDNALDACETAGVAPEVGVEAEYILDQDPAVLRLAISDNGPGMPPELINKILDYNVRVSDKMAYRSPTRGAQGNALKTVIGIPYALGSEDPITITARRVRHTIRPWVDPGGHVRVSHTKVAENGLSNGTRITLTIPLEAQSLAEDDARHWLRSFAAFNPHVTFRYQGKNAPSKEGEIYKSTQEHLFKKYIPSEPTSPHWYSQASLKALVFSHIADAHGGGGRDLPSASSCGSFRASRAQRKPRLCVRTYPSSSTYRTSRRTRMRLGSCWRGCGQNPNRPKHPPSATWGRTTSGPSSRTSTTRLESLRTSGATTARCHPAFRSPSSSRSPLSMSRAISTVASISHRPLATRRWRGRPSRGQSSRHTVYAASSRRGTPCRALAGHGTAPRLVWPWQPTSLRLRPCSSTAGKPAWIWKGPSAPWPRRRTLLAIRAA